MSSHADAFVHGIPSGTEGAGILDEWNRRKPDCLPRDRLLGKPDPAPVDVFLFGDPKK